MDSSHLIKLENRLTNLLVDIDVELRTENVILFQKFHEVESLLSKLKNDSVNAYVKKNLIYDLCNTWSALFNQLGYSSNDEKKLLLSTLENFYKVIHDFLYTDVQTTIADEHFFIKSLERTKYQKGEVDLILDQIANYYSNKDNINSQIVILVFKLCKDALYKSKIVTDSCSCSWEELVENNDIDSISFLEIARKTIYIFE